MRSTVVNAYWPDGTAGESLIALLEKHSTAGVEYMAL
jgi:hypothetical protein